MSGPVGFGFRRLSIIDLNSGHQPISNEDGTVWIVFNGEIYNYRELREQLRSKGHVFRTQTDTEIIVHLYEEFGSSCVARLRGMFAFAIWDERQDTLFLARDRVGIKPLYYWLTDRSIVFGSEIKAILADPEVNAEVIPGMIDRFLAFYYVPGEETLFRNIHKLAPGSFMIVRDGRVQTKQYWDLQFEPVDQTVKQAEERLLTLLDESLRLHMIADVPVGFLLSGGVDSTAMLSLAVGKTDHTLRSFTLGFTAPNVVDERPYATLASQRYGSQHYDLTISAQEFADFLPKYAWHMEEPVCEPTAVALYYVSRLAKSFVKVLISGEGGDEAFAGYPNYRNMLWLERLKTVTGPFSRVVSTSLSFANLFVGSKRLERYLPMMRLPFEGYYYSRISGPASFFNANRSKMYTKDFAKFVNPEASVSPVKTYSRNAAGSGYVNRMLYVDTKSALPDDLLLKADKMTMANSIELRVPLLDHELLEFAAGLPEDLKVRGFTTKYIAKKALRNLVPRQILDRKKVGFPTPFSSWLKTDLNDLVHDILLDRETLSRGYFDKACIEGLIREHSESERFPKEILSLISLELWHRAFLSKTGDTSDVLIPTVSAES